MDRVVNGLFVLALGLAALTWATEPFRTIHLVLVYLLVAVVACNQYDQRANEGISMLFSIQVAIAFGLGIVLLALSLGGLGVRVLEGVLVFSLVLAFVLVRDDLLAFARTNLAYLLAFSVVFGIFLGHSLGFVADSSLGLFPVYAGFVLAFNLFCLPRYVDDDAVLWSVASVAGFFALLGLLVIVRGEFTWWLFEVRIWDGDASPWFVDRELPVIRSVFANPNTLGVLLFAGAVTAVAATLRTLRSGWPLLAILPAGLLALNGLGLYFTDSRASILAAAVAVGVYVAAALDRRLLPVAGISTAVIVPVLLLGIYVGVIPIDPANRFELWRAGIEAVRTEGSWLGEGIVGTRGVIEPYLADGVGSYSVHNSYLSIFIRIGLLGGIAYLVLVLGPLVHGLVRYDRVNVAMFTLAVGFAIHQLFEGYTFYQFGPGSIVGALAVGYVISSLTPDGGLPVGTTAETETNAPTEEQSDSNAGWPDAEPFGHLRNQYRRDADRHDDRP
ncbi:O-antigen ligase family protein [Halalkalicoccus ordinarius]|uniref:O-antigen ligase family protein n=1 Tax=Halalkalicoccus ordinarius TaxID=3116651 RepID=UPI00300F387B